MISNRRRIFIILISVTIGTVLAALLYRSRFASKPEYLSNMIMNFVFSFAMILAIAIFLARRNKQDKN